MTTPTTNQRDFATGPAFVPLPYTLLDAAEVVPFTGHQKLGVMYQVDSCLIPLEYSAACVTGGAPKSPNMDVLWRAADPFVVYSWLPCTFIGGEPPEKLRADTLAAHQNNVQKRVDDVFWTGGDFGVSQHLAEDTAILLPNAGPFGSTVTLQTAATIVTGGPVFDVVTGVAQLEQEMSECYGGTPWLHVPRELLSQMAAEHLFKDDLDSKGRLRTKAGSIVVAYSAENLGPNGAPSARGTSWIYATGAVKIWRGSVDFTAGTPAEMLVRSTNDTVLIAEERLVIGWDCCHFAALVTTA